jgi:hypothetical protein
VPLGKYWRSNPFVFSLEPRCHGEWGSQVDVHLRGQGDLRVPGQLGSLIPGQRLPQVIRQRLDGRQQAITDGRGAVVVGKVDEHDVSGLAFHQGGDGRAAVRPDDVGVGPGRGAGITPGPFPRPALRTGRATLIASGAPRTAVLCRNRGSCGKHALG